MLIFDLDGTLINSELYLKTIETELKCELGYPVTLEEQIKHFGGIGPHQQLEMDPSLPSFFATEAEKRFRECAEGNLKACPGVIDFLNNHEGPKAIASNGPLEWIQMATQVTGLDKYFKQDDFFHAGLVKNKKPAPDLFLLAAKKTRGSSEVIVVEDSITGIKAGVAAKMTTICYTETSPNPTLHKKLAMENGASAIFDNYSELASLILTVR